MQTTDDGTENGARKVAQITWLPHHIAQVGLAYANLCTVGVDVTPVKLSIELRKVKYRMMLSRGVYPTVSSCSRLLKYHRKEFDLRAGTVDMNKQLRTESSAAVGGADNDDEEEEAGTDSESESESESESDFVPDADAGDDSVFMQEAEEEEAEAEEDDESGGDSPMAGGASEAPVRVEPNDIIHSIRAFATELKEMQDKHAQLKAKNAVLKGKYAVLKGKYVHIVTTHSSALDGFASMISDAATACRRQALEE